jgi:hypothetical protein
MMEYSVSNIPIFRFSNGQAIHDSGHPLQRQPKLVCRPSAHIGFVLNDGPFVVTP